jgi:hypothetical protein
MFSSTKQSSYCLTETGLRKIARSAAFCILFLSALTCGSDVAAEITYHLVGTIESKDFTGAVIITPDGKQTFYHLQEKLPDGAELVQVHDRSVSLKGSDGSRYEMFITSAGTLQTAAAPGAPSITPRQAHSPTDKYQKYNPPGHRTHRSSSSEE